MAIHSAAGFPFEELKPLWRRSLGDPRVRVAVLDGPVDLGHPCFQGADLAQLESWIGGTACRCESSQHGTHVASIIFGQHGSPVHGIAPRCRGIVVPVFEESEDGEILPCSQLDLARAIAQAVEAGANIVNISGGQLEASGKAEAPLARTIKTCLQRGVLVVAAAGNEGCQCLHVPAALPSVLAVGAMSAQGEPLGFSNWGSRYAAEGVLAPGENVPGAAPGGGVLPAGGTSVATAVVSGVAALLMSIQIQDGEGPNAQAIRAAILRSAIDCTEQPIDDCRRLLAGRLNAKGALLRIEKGGRTAMSEQNLPEEQPQTSVSDAGEGAASDTPASAGQPPVSSTCATGSPETWTCPPNPPPEAGASRPGPVTATGNLVFALGQLGYDFGTEANRDYFKQQGMEAPESRGEMVSHLTLGLADEALFERLLGPDPPPPKREDFPEGEEGERQSLAALREREREIALRERTRAMVGKGLLVNKADASGLVWTLVQDLTPIYAVLPGDAFGLAAYDRLIEFLDDQESGRAEQVAVAGRLVGQATLMNGQSVPVVRPDVRGMYNWSADKLVEAAMAAIEGLGEADRERVESEVKAFAERVYYDYRNLGITAEDRALNFAATNLFQAASAYTEAVKTTADGTKKLDRIDVERSPICRPGSDCWDVKLTFFNPAKRQQEAKQVFRFTVDVSGAIPVTVGEMRSWYIY
jgi:hypothetical protein